MTNEEHWQWLPPMVAFGLAVASIGLVGATAVHHGDAADYMAAAHTLLERHGYPRESSLPFFRPPLYPLLVALTWMFTPNSVLAVKLVQAALFSVTSWLLYHLAFGSCGSRPASLMGALLFAANPFALMQVADVQTETLHTTLLAAALLALAQLIRTEVPSRRYALLAGVLFGLASLCRPTALPVGIALALAIGLVRCRERPYARSWLTTCIMIAGIALTITPWTLLNWRSTGEPILITDAAGYHLWLYNHPATIRLYEGKFRDRKEFDDFGYQYLQQRLPRSRMEEWEGSGGYRLLTLEQRERRWQREALSNMHHNPGLTARLWVDKVWAIWRPWLQPAAYSPKTVFASGILLVSLYLMAGLGALQLRGNTVGRRYLALMAALFVSSTMVHMVTAAKMTYRLPYVDPYLSLLAGVALWALVSRTTTVPAQKIIQPVGAHWRVRLRN
jgi:hypothetical protein